MRFLARMAVLCVLCLFALHQVQAQEAACAGDHLCINDAPVVVSTWAASSGPRWPDQSQAPIKPASLAARARCLDASVTVTAASTDERRLVCSAASNALQLLSRCKIYPRESLHVQITKMVQHPFSGLIFGLLDTKQEKVLVTQEANIPSLTQGTPYSVLPQRDFYKSLIVHEVIHGVMHQNLAQRPTSRAAHEYPAYALQIASLPSEVRAQFLSSIDTGASREFLLNDFILALNPYAFAALAYRHFKESSNGCTHLHALLVGDVDFIRTFPLL